VGQELSAAAHSAMCIRLMRLFPRVIREMRRHQDRTTPATLVPLGPRHVAALEQLRDGPLTVGDLAGRNWDTWQRRFGALDYVVVAAAIVVAAVLVLRRRRAVGH